MSEIEQLRRQLEALTQTVGALGDDYRAFLDEVQRTRELLEGARTEEITLLSIDRKLTSYLGEVAAIRAWQESHALEHQKLDRENASRDIAQKGFEARLTEVQRHSTPGPMPARRMTSRPDWDQEDPSGHHIIDPIALGEAVRELRDRANRMEQRQYDMVSQRKASSHPPVERSSAEIKVVEEVRARFSMKEKIVAGVLAVVMLVVTHFLGRCAGPVAPAPQTPAVEQSKPEPKGHP